MRKQNVFIGKKKVAYYKEGNRNQPILFIHGNSLSSDIFLNQINAQQLRKRFTIYAIDLCGYGDSSWSENPGNDYSIRSQAKLIIDFCKLFHIRNPVLAGHSLGGNLMIEAETISRNAKALVFASSSPFKKPISPEMFIQNPITRLFFKTQLSKEETEKMINAVMVNPDKGTTPILDLIEKSDPNIRVQLGVSVENQEYNDQVQELKSTNAPILFLFGKEKDIYDIDYLRKLDIPIGSDQIQLIENSGHLPFYEQAESFNKLLLKFTEQISG